MTDVTRSRPASSNPTTSNQTIPNHTTPLLYSRRHILRSLALSSAALALGGCGSTDAVQLNIATLTSTFPGSVRGNFRTVSPFPVQFFPVENRGQLFQLLTPPKAASGGWLSGLFDWLGSLQQSVFPPPQRLSLSLLGAGWLDTAIAQNLLIPLDDNTYSDSVAAQLPERWQQAALRQDKLWGLPWNWGVTAIAYDRQQVSSPIEDWQDLWRPELARKVVLPDHPREVIGLALKSLGQSYNSPLSELEADLGNSAVRDRLESLQKQVLTYSSDNYLPALMLGDAAVVVGWSSDLYQLARIDRRFEVIVPNSGSALWWDLWVLPKQLNDESATAQLQEAAQAWFEFLMGEDIPRRAAVTSRQPISIPVNLEQLPDMLKTRLTFQPDVLARAELLEPLSEQESRQYLELWKQLRSD